MSLRKVYGGTPVGDESRCDTCTHARIIEGYAESERITFCDAMYDPIRIPFKVRQCKVSVVWTCRRCLMTSARALFHCLVSSAGGRMVESATSHRLSLSGEA